MIGLGAMVLRHYKFINPTRPYIVASTVLTEQQRCLRAISDSTTELKKLKHDMDPLTDPSSSPASLHQRSPSELKGILEHAALCLNAFEELQKQLRKLTN